MLEHALYIIDFIYLFVAYFCVLLFSFFVSWCGFVAANKDVYISKRLSRLGWRFGVAVTRWSRSTQLLYIEPG